MTEQEAIRSRLFQAIDQCGETLKEVANRTETNYSYLSALRNKTNFDISATLIAKVSKHYKINPIWLLTGKGDMKATKPAAGGDISKRLQSIEDSLQALMHRDQMLEMLLEALLTPKPMQKLTDLQKLMTEAKRRKN
jgi:hypothetical protein